jgi:hypothetical protein
MISNYDGKRRIGTLSLEDLLGILKNDERPNIISAWAMYIERRRRRRCGTVKNEHFYTSHDGFSSPDPSSNSILFLDKCVG